MNKHAKLYDHWMTGAKAAAKEFKRVIKKVNNLSKSDAADLAERKHDEVFNEIDCMQCANCCKSIPPIVNENDVKRISKYLGMKALDFKESYIEVDEDEDMVINATPCPFLKEDNACDIYDVRPKACQEYPHTEGHDFVENIKLHIKNIRYCPAAFHIIHRMEEELYNKKK